MSDLEVQQYNELAFYTLSLNDPSFIHQNIVDSYAAQKADLETKPITIIFALAGLYLHVEKNFTGRQVQLFHIKMAKNKRKWPAIILPAERGDIKISDVLAVSPGIERDKMIHLWCRSVWESYCDSHPIITDLLRIDFRVNYK